MWGFAVCFLWLSTEYLKVLDRWSGGTRLLKTPPWTLGRCDGHVSLFYEVKDLWRWILLDPWRIEVAAGEQNHQSLQISSSKISLFFNLIPGDEEQPDAQRLDGQSQSIVKFYIFSAGCFPLPRSDHKTSGVFKKTVGGGTSLFSFFDGDWGLIIIIIVYIYYIIIVFASRCTSGSALSSRPALHDDD